VVAVGGIGGVVCWSICVSHCGLCVALPSPTFHSNGFLVIWARKNVWCFVMWIASM